MELHLARAERRLSGCKFKTVRSVRANRSKERVLTKIPASCLQIELPLVMGSLEGRFGLVILPVRKLLRLFASSSAFFKRREREALLLNLSEFIKSRAKERPSQLTARTKPAGWELTIFAFPSEPQYVARRRLRLFSVRTVFVVH